MSEREAYERDLAERREHFGLDRKVRITNIDGVPMANVDDLADVMEARGAPEEWIKPLRAMRDSPSFAGFSSDPYAPGRVWQGKAHEILKEAQ